MCRCIALHRRQRPIRARLDGSRLGSNQPIKVQTSRNPMTPQKNYQDDVTGDRTHTTYEWNWCHGMSLMRRWNGRKSKKVWNTRGLVKWFCLYKSRAEEKKFRNRRLLSNGCGVEYGVRDIPISQNFIDRGNRRTMHHNLTHSNSRKAILVVTCLPPALQLPRKTFLLLTHEGLLSMAKKNHCKQEAGIVENG